MFVTNIVLHNTKSYQAVEYTLQYIDTRIENMMYMVHGTYRKNYHRMENSTAQCTFNLPYVNSVKTENGTVHNVDLLFT